ncbi:MAG TPA: PHP domain-containing protein [Acidimicrobiales bacterium]|nr:PHP domain-containing protein [Acidimicrobiales bacterium]
MIDLHTHSTESDGSEPPGSIPQRAAAAGCSALALTDHDSLDGLAEARAAADRVGVTLVPGCEVSCRKPPPPAGGQPIAGGVHVLVYFVEPGEGPLQDELRNLRRDRAARNARLRQRLAELGVPVDYDAMVADAGAEAGLGRPHFARALVRSGAAEDIDDAFDRFLADGRAAYVPKARLSPSDVARLATASGGVAVLAHPLTLGLDPSALERLVAELAGAGLAGIEAIYGRYSTEQRRGLKRMATRCGVVATGGSDYHGSFKPDLEVGTGMGDLDVPDSVLEALAARCP